MSSVMESSVVDVPQFPGYKADRNGNLVSFKYNKPRTLIQHLGPNGYKSVSMTRFDGEIKRVLVHRIVAATFHGECPEGAEVRHLDGNRLNNTATNLMYGTRSENRQDSESHGTAPVGKKHGMHKLSEEDVYQIRWALDTGVHTLRELEGMFGIEKTQLSRIGARESWKSLPERTNGMPLTIEQQLRGIIKPAMNGDECWIAVRDLLNNFKVEPIAVARKAREMRTEK